MNEYIIVANKGVDLHAFVNKLQTKGVEMVEDYNFLLRHFHVKMTELLKAEVEVMPETQLVDKADRQMRVMLAQHIKVTGWGTGDNWGLARISKRSTDWKDTSWYPFNGDFKCQRTGDNVDVYVVDTGIRRSHSDFTGRVDVIYDHYRQKSDPLYGEDTEGHGTHVASIAAGSKYGVAKAARIKVSRVFENGGATLSAIIAGINACLQDHMLKINRNINRPSIMNLSLGGPSNAIEELAINDCIDNGLVCVAAAGNDGKNLDSLTYNVMPAEIERAITVGSVNIQDRQSSFSNYGEIVDIFAPGHYISAAGINNDSAEAMLSGTSMAAPHVTGVCALYVQDRNIGRVSMDVRVVHDWVKSNATESTLVLSSAAVSTGTPNRMLFSDFVASDKMKVEPVVEPPKKHTKMKIRGRKAWRGRVPDKRDEKFEALIDNLLSMVQQNKASTSIWSTSSTIEEKIAELEVYIGDLLLGSRREAMAAFPEVNRRVLRLKRIIAGDKAIVSRKIIPSKDLSL